MNKYLLSLFILLALSSNSWAAILVVSPNGTYTTKTTLEAARTAADVASKTIVITSALTQAQSNITAAWPSDRALTVKKGGSIANSTAFTINAPFSAGNYQVFTGAGSVLFGSGSASNVPSTWFGGDGAAIQKALDSVVMTSASAELSGQFGAVVTVPSGRYLVTTTLSVPPNVNIKGEGKLSTILQASGLTSGMAVIRYAGSSGGQTHSKISDMTISGNNIAGIIGVDFWDGTGGASQQNFATLENCYLVRYAVGANVDSTDASKYIIYSKIINCTFDSGSSAYTASIQFKNAINWFRVEGNHFFGSSTAGGRAILTDTTTIPDSIWLVNNSIDNSPNADGATLYLTALAGSQSVGYFLSGNRIEGSGVYVAGAYATANIKNNSISDAPYCVKSVGSNVQIEGNTLLVKSGASTTTNSTAIIIASGATDNVIGWNNYGTPGDPTYAAIRYSDAGTKTVQSGILWTSIGQTGTYLASDIVSVPSITLGRADRYRCTVAGSINAAAVATTGSIADTSNTLTVASGTGFERGMIITIAGVTGAKTIQHRSGNTITLTSAADATVSGAAVALQAPTFQASSWTVKKSTTANRPSLNSSEVGVMYLDTTLDADGKPVWWTGTGWVDATGAGV